MFFYECLEPDDKIIQQLAVLYVIKEFVLAIYLLKIIRFSFHA